MIETLRVIVDEPEVAVIVAWQLCAVPGAPGVAVTEMLMALYRAAEIGQVLELPAPELETYVPPLARL